MSELVVFSSIQQCILGSTFIFIQGGHSLKALSTMVPTHPISSQQIVIEWFLAIGRNGHGCLGSSWNRPTGVV